MQNIMQKFKNLINIKKYISTEKQIIKKLNNDLNKQDLSIKNKQLLQILSALSKHSYKLNLLEKQYTYLKVAKRLQFVIDLKSRVKLVSTKLGAIVWVDARQYLDLLNKKVGDIVMLYNSPYLIASVY
jgi:hypothetical protein